MSKEKKIKILFVGSLYKGSTASHRLYAVKKIISNVHYIDNQIIKNQLLFLTDKALKKIFSFTINSFLLNRITLTEIINFIPDVVWIDKGIEISSFTLEKIMALLPNTKLIHYSPDDMINPSNLTSYYLSSIPLYDLHVTTKSYNLNELYKLGARKVLFVNNTYASEVHKPYVLTDVESKKYSSDVSFIGGPELERASSINWLAENGIKVTIWGRGWSRYLIKNPNININHGWFADDEYCKIICATKINLAYLRKVNRDLQTTRTMEIPACGGFMLTERTNEHLNLFREDKEAAFFSNNKELKEKIEYYLRNEKERIRIALNGLQRCRESGYDNVSMIHRILEYL